MVGEKVMLRVRMSERDAHYAGGLVNGSRILDFFGDVATELCIRCDKCLAAAEVQAVPLS